MKNSAKNLPDKNSNQMSSAEAHEDLNEFKATKKSVNDLLNYKRSMSEMNKKNIEEISEMKRRAIEAIDQLFDIINPKKAKGF